MDLLIFLHIAIEGKIPLTSADIEGLLFCKWLCFRYGVSKLINKNKKFENEFNDYIQNCSEQEREDIFDGKEVTIDGKKVALALTLYDQVNDRYICPIPYSEILDDIKKSKSKDEYVKKYYSELEKSKPVQLELDLDQEEF